MDLCFVDVETTGLDPVRHELIELAAVRVDRHTLEPLDHVSVKVRPERLADADPKALEVNEECRLPYDATRIVALELNVEVLCELGWRQT